VGEHQSCEQNHNVKMDRCNCLKDNGKRGIDYWITGTVKLLNCLTNSENSLMDRSFSRYIGRVPVINGKFQMKRAKNSFRRYRRQSTWD